MMKEPHHRWTSNPSKAVTKQAITIVMLVKIVCSLWIWQSLQNEEIREKAYSSTKALTADVPDVSFSISKTDQDIGSAFKPIAEDMKYLSICCTPKEVCASANAWERSPDSGHESNKTWCSRWWIFILWKSSTSSVPNTWLVRCWDLTEKPWLCSR